MKRYTVFVSSTKTDLEEERKAVIKAIIELKYMPASMEYFPASNERSWSTIQRVIDESDYYVLILGAKYGSIDEESGLSFTEREYRYARSIGVPTIAFLHCDPDGLPSRLHDNRQRLKAFYDHVKTETLCKFWKNRGDLALMAATSLVNLIEENPRSGWMKADRLLCHGFDHPASNFIESNIVSLLYQPYRENLEAQVEYSHTENPNVLQVTDKVHYKCSAFQGSIDKHIKWSFEPGEFLSMDSISIKIKKQTGEEKVILMKSDFNDDYSQHGFLFEHNLSDEWDVDNLLVITEGRYSVSMDHFESWEMLVLTEGFTLTMTYPNDLKIFYMPYINSYKDNDVTDREGFFSYKQYNWVLPNEGLCWQFFRPDF